MSDEEYPRFCCVCSNLEGGKSEIVTDKNEVATCEYIKIYLES